MSDVIPTSVLNGILAAFEKAHIVVHDHGTPEEYREVSEALAALYDWRTHLLAESVRRSMKGPPTYNVRLRGGPGDGLLMEMPASTGTLAWDSPWREPELGQYRRTEEVEEGLQVFDWYEAV